MAPERAMLSVSSRIILGRECNFWFYYHNNPLDFHSLTTQKYITTVQHLNPNGLQTPNLKKWEGKSISAYLSGATGDPHRHKNTHTYHTYQVNMTGMRERLGCPGVGLGYVCVRGWTERSLPAPLSTPENDASSGSGRWPLSFLPMQIT